MERKRKSERDDEAQSQRFIDMAREIGADASNEEFERAFRTVVPPKAAPEKKTKERRPTHRRS